MLFRAAITRLNPFFAMLKIGSGWLLLGFDLVVWILIIVDLNKIRELNLDVFHTSLAAKRAWESFGPSHLLVAGTIFFLPPLLTSLVTFLLRNYHMPGRAISSPVRHGLLIFHFATSVFFAVFVSLIPELQLLSGFKGDLTDSYESSSYQLITRLLGGSTALVAAASGLAKIVGKTNLEEFKLWFKLSDSSSELFSETKSEPRLCKYCFDGTAYRVDRQEGRNLPIRVPETCSYV